MNTKANKSWVGKKVRALDEGAFAPYKGAIGTVIEFDDTDGAHMPCKVFWEDSALDMWVCNGSIELVEDDKPTLMPYDEIWEMLKPTMEKNGLLSHCYGVYSGVACLYSPKDFQKAVALAYKMGYERAMKGRPFKYGEEKVKKVEGHWEKVDPENLPEEGARVRYARPTSLHDGYPIYIGDTGSVHYYLGTFGMNADVCRGFYRFVTFISCPECLDYWVEGDDAD